MIRRPLLALSALAAAAALLLAACTGGSDGPTAAPSASADAATDAATDGTTASTGERTPLTIGLTYVPDIQFSPFYLADSLGYYRDAGLDVTLRHHGANEGLFTAIEQGQEDVVVASGDEVLTERAAGGTLTQVATLYDTSPVALIAPVGGGITTAADLRGKTIGVPGEYGATYLGLLVLLDEAGLTPSDVTIQSIGYTQTTALLTKQVDAVMGYLNGDAVRIEAGGMAVTTLEPGSLVGVGIAVPDALLASDPDAVWAFVTATLQGVAAVEDDPEGAVEVAADGYIPGMTSQAKADALAVLEATIPLLSTTGETDPAEWDAMAQAMLAAGMITSVPDGGFTNP